MSRDGMIEKANAAASCGASRMVSGSVTEQANAEGHYTATAFGPVEQFRAEYIRTRDYIARCRARFPWVWRIAARKAIERLAAIPTEQKWSEAFANVVTTEGKNAGLTNHLKGSAFTQTVFMGLIEATGYGFAGAQGSGVAATNLASSITAVGGASPANGWNEATSAQCASRGTPTFGTASAGALALSANQSFSILATVTIRGVFLMVRSAAGVAATATVGNTAGAIYSAGLFSNGDRALGNGDTLQVSYTASL